MQERREELHQEEGTKEAAEEEKQINKCVFEYLFVCVKDDLEGTSWCTGFLIHSLVKEDLESSLAHKLLV